MNIYLYFLYLILTALILALWEIQIEGKHGWASRLPTKRFNNDLVKSISGGRPITGYHLMMLLTILVLIHLPVFFTDWSWYNEAKIIGFFILMLTIEDFLWFVFNPDWGISEFKKSRKLWWHPGWLLGLPIFYWFTIPIGILVILWGFAIIG
ncbi:hypothetical protein ACFL04_02890 [Patescibacteria group bacterium]